MLPTERVACVCCGSSGNAAIEAEATDYEYGTTTQLFAVVRCGGCGHLFLNPRPTAATAPLIYPSTYYTQAGGHAGLLGRIKDVVVVRRFRQLMADMPPDCAILDVGCGDGALLLALRAAFPRCRLAGVDAAIAPAHRARLERAGIELLEGLVETASLGRERFDLVVMNQVIEHLWDVRAAMRAIHAALKPGGLVTISTPDSQGYDRRWFRHGSWGGYYVPRHLNLFTAANLAGLLRTLGYDIVDQRALVAPLIWVRNLQYTFYRRGSRLSRWFTDRNFGALALFTAMDLMAITFRVPTSNQQCVARRPRLSRA